MTDLQHTILSILAYTPAWRGLLTVAELHHEVCGYDWQGAPRKHPLSRESIRSCLYRLEAKGWVKRSSPGPETDRWGIEYSGREALKI